MKLFAVQPLRNHQAAARGGFYLPGDTLVPCGDPFVVLATSHEEAARAAAAQLRAAFSWSAGGLQPGDGLAVAGGQELRIFAIASAGLAELTPAPQPVAPGREQVIACMRVEDVPTPYVLSVRSSCTLCGAAVWLSARLHRAMPRARTVCTRCIPPGTPTRLHPATLRDLEEWSRK